jgi:hypothetical protein
VVKEVRFADLQAAALKEVQENDHPGEGSIDDHDVVERPNEDTICDATAMPRPPYESPSFSDGMMLVAVDAETRHPSDQHITALGVHIGTLLGRNPVVSVDSYKMGAAIADRMKIGIPPKWLAMILGLKDVDSDLNRAIEATLCGVVATTVAPIDIGTLLYGIGNLLHAHPAFAAVVKDATWEHPYGERTTYQMARVTPDSLPDDPEADEKAIIAETEEGK